MPGDLLLLENCDIIIKIYYNSQYMMISGAKGQKAVHACMIRLLNLGPAEHEEVAIYVVNQRIPNVRELRELLRSGAIRGYQVRGKIFFAPNFLLPADHFATGFCDQNSNLPLCGGKSILCTHSPLIQLICPDLIASHINHRFDCKHHTRHHENAGIFF